MPRQVGAYGDSPSTFLGIPQRPQNHVNHVNPVKKCTWIPVQLSSTLCYCNRFFSSSLTAELASQALAVDGSVAAHL